MYDPESFGSWFVYPSIPTILNLTISDTHKPMLLANPGYIPHCVDGLTAMLDAELACVMALAGVRSIAEIDRSLVQLHDESGPGRSRL